MPTGKLIILSTFVGVHVSDAEGARREILRGDRHAGWNRGSARAARAHAIYDVEIDTTSVPPNRLAQQLVDEHEDGDDEVHLDGDRETEQAMSQRRPRGRRRHRRSLARQQGAGSLAPHRIVLFPADASGHDCLVSPGNRSASIALLVNGASADPRAACP
jgi:hypothetical protein